MITKVNRNRLRECSRPGIRAAVVKEALGGYSDIAAWFADILTHGCQSGMVSSLVFSSDTCDFYDANEQEIEDYVVEGTDDIGARSRLEFILSLNGGDKIATVDEEKNLLAWYGFESTARVIACELGLEI